MCRMTQAKVKNCLIKNGLSAEDFRKIEADSSSFVIICLFCFFSLNMTSAELRSIMHPSTHELLDKGIILWFPSPASFTGEDVFEMHIHGSRAVIADTMDALEYSVCCIVVVCLY